MNGDLRVCASRAAIFEPSLLYDDLDFPPRVQSILVDKCIDRVHRGYFESNPLQRTQAYEFRLNFARNSRFFSEPNVLESGRLRRDT